MKISSNDTLYIYHHNDIDGEAAAGMVNLHFPNNKKYFIKSDYPISVNPAEFRYKPTPIVIFFVDLSFKPQDLPMLKELVDTGCQIIWIDHHKSSIDLLATGRVPKEIDYLVDSSRCGAFLTYQYLHRGELHNIDQFPKFLGLIDHYDRHVKDQYFESSVCFNFGIMAIDNLNPTSDVWRELLTGDQIIANYYIERGKIIYGYLQEYNKMLLKSSAVIIKVRGITCIALNTMSNSIVFESVRDKFPLCMAWRFDGKLYKYSIYNEDGTVDCNAIANTFGGGGHPGAAGFSSEQLLFFTEECEKYNPEKE